MRVILAAAQVFLSCSGWAGTREVHEGGTGVGNGGDSLVCASAREEMLDTFELRVFEGRMPILSGAPDFKTKVDDVLNRLAPLSPLRAKTFRARFAELLRNTTFVDQELPDVPDSQHSLIPMGCEVKQIVIQSRANGEVFLTVNRPLWDRLDEDNRAALYLHELSYAEAIDRGAVNSIAARRFNGVLLSLPVDITEFAQRVGSRSNANSTFPMEIPLPSGDVLLVSQFHWEDFEAARGPNPSFTSKSVCGVYFPRFPFPLDACHDGVTDSHHELRESTVKDGQILTFWPRAPLSPPVDGTPVGVSAPIRGFDFLENRVWSSGTIFVPVAGRSVPCRVMTLDPAAVIPDRKFRLEVSLVDSCQPNADHDEFDDKVSFQFLPAVAKDDIDFVSFTRDKGQASRPVIGFSAEPYRFSPPGSRHYINYPDIATDRGVLTNLGWGRIDEDYGKSTVSITNYCQSNCPRELNLLVRDSETCRIDGTAKLSWQSGTLKLMSADFLGGCKLF